MNILEEFYYGNVNPQEKFYKRESEYATFVRIISENEEKLNAYLDGEEKHSFSKLMSAQSEIISIENRERFIEGTFLVPRYSPINGVCEE